MRLTILGSGGSSGTPSIDCGWGNCNPDNPRNRRLRPSVLVEAGETKVLVDTSPDLREQLLSVGVRRLDAVFYTHGHADHLHGIDDLRAVNRVLDGPLDIYGDGPTLAIIAERFPYVISPLRPGAAVRYKPTLVPHEIAPGQPVRAGTLEVMPFAQDHGVMMTLGFRFGAIAYSTDVVDLPAESFALLDGVEAWVIGVLGDEPHPTHAHVGKALDWIARVRPKRAVLTHLSGFLDYDALSARLPEGVEAAYDGLVLDIGNGG